MDEEMQMSPSRQKRPNLAGHRTNMETFMSKEKGPRTTIGNIPGHLEPYGFHAWKFSIYGHIYTVSTPRTPCSAF